MENAQVVALTSEYVKAFADKYEGIEIMPERTMSAVIRPFLRWLSTRYCLVEKAKVEQVNQCIQAKAVQVVMTLLFPEIAKEVK